MIHLEFHRTPLPRDMADADPLAVRFWPTVPRIGEKLALHPTDDYGCVTGAAVPFEVEMVLYLDVTAIHPSFTDGRAQVKHDCGVLVVVRPL